MEVELINLNLKDKKKLLDISELKFRDFILNVPNILDKKVPKGDSEKNNKVIKFSHHKNLEKEKNTNFSDHI